MTLSFGIEQKHAFIFCFIPLGSEEAVLPLCSINSTKLYGKSPSLPSILPLDHPSSSSSPNISHYLCECVTGGKE